MSKDPIRAGEIVVFNVDVSFPLLGSSFYFWFLMCLNQFSSPQGRDIPIVHRVIKVKTDSLSSSLSFLYCNCWGWLVHIIGSRKGEYRRSRCFDKRCISSVDLKNFTGWVLTCFFHSVILQHTIRCFDCFLGDNNYGDDRLLYAEGQQWLHRHHIMGRAVG